MLHTKFLTAGFAGLTTSTCITTHQAAQVGHNFGLLVSNYSDALANNVLASGFTDQIDSVITLIDGAAQPQEPLAVCFVKLT